jgi:hypothetical protein
MGAHPGGGGRFPERRAPRRDGFTTKILFSGNENEFAIFATNMLTDPKQERELMTDLWSPALADDLLAHVRYSYPWGVKGTPLESFKGPRKWQCEDLDEISQHIADNKGRIALDSLPRMFQKATVSAAAPASRRRWHG